MDRHRLPYGLLITPDQHIGMVDGGYDGIIEHDQNGKILAAFGGPGHTPGQLAWAHCMALGHRPQPSPDQLHSIGKDVLGFDTRRRMDLTADGDCFQIRLYSR